MTFDLRTGQPKGSYAFPPPASACNDIALDSDGSALATDTPNGRIFKLAKGAKALELYAQDDRLKGVDGIVFGGDGTLYVNIVSRGALVRVDRKPDRTFSALTELKLSEPVKGPDGFRPISGNRFLLAEGNSGRIDEVTIRGDDAQIRVLREGLNSPPGVTLVGNTAYAVEGKISYLFDPKLKGQDPGVFTIHRDFTRNGYQVTHRMRSIWLGLAGVLAATAISSPRALAQAPGEPSAVVAMDCDYKCLTGFVSGYMNALAKKDVTRVRFAPNVRFTENDVELSLGHEGLWKTITAVAPNALQVADVTTGQGAWIGTVEEHGDPAYYGMRLRVQDKQIVEVETIVVRKTGLPLPFGDAKKLVHDPAFAEVLTPEQRRPRERLHAVADSYFNTVELNDGVVFAPFDAECARIENGIVTTAAGAGSSGDIAAGCENQFKLGIYRINKRIRERRYALIDEERGVVVATGFFDHANTFDTYKTTDGKDRKTALKWPNSISLVEAFKIRDGRIYRIEAIFTYVPYFMHSPFYETLPVQRPVTAPAEAPNPKAKPCDRKCLIGVADSYTAAMVTQKPETVSWAPTVRFTENSVPMMIGDGLWGSARKKSSTPLYVTDPASGTVVWYGLVEEHDAPSYLGVRLKVSDGRISEVESAVSRKLNPGPFGDPAAYRLDPLFDQVLPPALRQPRERMEALVEGYYSTKQLNDGTLFTQFDPTCSRRDNGLDVTDGAGNAAVIAPAGATGVKGCEAQFKLGLYRPVDRVRSRRILAVDEERGLIVATAFADFAVDVPRYSTTDGTIREVQGKYPSSRESIDVFKIRNGKIVRVEAVSVFQPYGMRSPWAP